MEETLWSQKKTIHLIKDLERFPCLWDYQNTEYKKRTSKLSALEILANKYRATIVDIERKIQVIKSQYRRERRKLASGKRHENGPLWFGYHYALYLQHANAAPNARKSNENNHAKEIKPPPADEAEESDNFFEDPLFQFASEKPSKNQSEPALEPPSKKQRITLQVEKPQQQPHKCDTEYNFEREIMRNVHKQTPFIALAWGEKLITLEKQQRLLAEKAINEILFEASQNMLHRNSVKINDDVTYACDSPTQNFYSKAMSSEDNGDGDEEEVELQFIS